AFGGVRRGVSRAPCRQCSTCVEVQIECEDVGSSDIWPAPPVRRVVATSGEPGKPVVGEGLPSRSEADVLTRARADSGVLVERAHANPDRICVLRIANEKRRGAGAAQPLL